MTTADIKWQGAKLAEIATFTSGRTPSRADPNFWRADAGAGVPWVTIADMKPFATIMRTSERVSPIAFERVFGGRLVSAGTLLMSYKLTIGRVAWLGTDAVHNEAIAAIYPSAEVDSEYLGFYLSQIDYSLYQDRAVKGDTLNLAKLARLDIQFPPLHQQKEIARSLRRVRDALTIADQERTTLEALFASLRGQLLSIPEALRAVGVGLADDT